MSLAHVPPRLTFPPGEQIVPRGFVWKPLSEAAFQRPFRQAAQAAPELPFDESFPVPVPSLPFWGPGWLMLGGWQ